MKELVDVNPMTGRKSYIEVDQHNGDLIITDTYAREITAQTLDQNARIAEFHGGKPGESMRLAASIPPEVVYDMLDKHGVDLFNPEQRGAALKLLNSNEYYKTRVWAGQL